MKRISDGGDGDRRWLVGRDRAGSWLAIEMDGRGGGMFATQEAALRFARVETAFRPEGVIVSEAPIRFR